MVAFIGADLGTSGCKAALYDESGLELARAFRPYPTFYPRPGFHEQRLQDWWDGFVGAVHDLIDQVPASRDQIAGLALSGQSLALIPLDDCRQPLKEAVPIWSDTRATEQSTRFFQAVDENEWYLRTGNGFPSPLYTLFKIMWLRDNEPEVFAATRTIIGSKDWINLQLTGNVATDPSYASGSGAFDLAGHYSHDLLEAARVNHEWLPSIYPSTHIVGELGSAAARDLGLLPGIAVVNGGVDNSCMALGAQNTQPGRVYASLGSSSWLTVCGTKPILDPELRPFVFAHVIPSMFNSAVSTFSSGTAVGWAMASIFTNLDGDIDALVRLGLQARLGAEGAVFIPTVGGGTVFEGGPQVRGGFLGLTAGSEPSHLARSVIESIPLSLRLPLDRLRNITHISDRMVVTGGGARNDDWLQIYANALNCTLVKTNVEQQAATLGAATLVALGLGVWSQYTKADDAHEVIQEFAPEPHAVREYTEVVLPAFKRASAAARSMIGPSEGADPQPA
jgi:xylulokinase